MTFIPTHITRHAPNADTLFSMTDKVNTNLDAIAAELAALGGNEAYTFRKSALTGGGPTALDGIDGDDLQGGETAIVFLGDNPAVSLSYVCDPDDESPQSSPNVILPAVNPGTKRWKLTSLVERMWTGASAPTVNDDITQGVHIGDEWLSGGDLWKCVDNGEGAASWLKWLKPGTTEGTACAGDDERIAAALAHIAAAAPHSGHASAADLLSHAGAAAPHSGHASLNEGKVVQDPQNATATPGASKIPLADGSGKLDSWISDAASETKGKIRLTGQLGGTAVSPTVLGLTESGGQALTFGAVADNQRLRRSGTQVVGETLYDFVTLTLDGGGSAIAAGDKGWFQYNRTGTIIDWTLLADQSGSIVVDVWKDIYENFPPTVADTITASAKPTLSNQQKNNSATLTGWNTALNAGDILKFNVDSASTVTRVTLTLKIRLS